MVATKPKNFFPSYDGKMDTIKQHEAIQLIYDYFNEKLFNSSLNNCILNFSRKSKAYGFFAPNRWSARIGKEHLHEISLNPEHLTRNPKEVVSTLVHEMCHLWQQDHGQPSPGYHNKEFAVKMRSIGLQCSHNGQIGGRETGKNMTHYILENGLYDTFYNKMPESFIYPFICMQEPQKKANKTKKNKTKYSCDCGQNIWGKPGLNVFCQDCKSLFQEID